MSPPGLSWPGLPCPGVHAQIQTKRCRHLKSRISARAARTSTCPLGHVWVRWATLGPLRWLFDGLLITFSGPEPRVKGRNRAIRAAVVLRGLAAHGRRRRERPGAAPALAARLRWGHKPHDAGAATSHCFSPRSVRAAVALARGLRCERPRALAAPAARWRGGHKLSRVHN